MEGLQILCGLQTIVKTTWRGDRVLFLVERQRESGRVHPTHHPNASKLSMSVPDSLSLLEKDSDVSHEIDATTVNHYYVSSVNTRRVARDRAYTNI